MIKLKKYMKVILLDALAVLCFVGVILFGWLPGPGGIPLFLAGLALLAVNHEWAERALTSAKNKTMNFRKALFPDNARVRQAYDSAALIFGVGAIYLFVSVNNPFLRTLSVALVCLCVVIFLVNRNRIDTLSKRLKKIKHKHL